MHPRFLNYILDPLKNLALCMIVHAVRYGVCVQNSTALFSCHILKEGVDLTAVMFSSRNLNTIVLWASVIEAGRPYTEFDNYIVCIGNTDVIIAS